MSTSREEISGWFDRGTAKNARWMIVVCDTFDWEDYPVFVEGHVNLKTSVASYDGVNMQKVMEVYDLHADKAEQLGKSRVRADLV
jgi:hypothetical protein